MDMDSVTNVDDAQMRLVLMYGDPDSGYETIRHLGYINGSYPHYLIVNGYVPEDASGFRIERIIEVSLSLPSVNRSHTRVILEKPAWTSPTYFVGGMLHQYTDGSGNRRTVLRDRCGGERPYDPEKHRIIKSGDL